MANKYVEFEVAWNQPQSSIYEHMKLNVLEPLDGVHTFRYIVDLGYFLMYC